MRRLKFAFFATVLAASSFNALACYTVYDPAGRVAYIGGEAPVDMSMPLHESMQARFPGGHLVFDTTTDCPNISLVSTRALRIAQAPLNSPLLTDAGTAERMNVRHTLVGNNIALIPAQAVTMASALTVVPASPATTAFASRAPAQRDVVITELRDGSVVDTRSMGAGPAPRR